jgi:hypothetical protein
MRKSARLGLILAVAAAMAGITTGTGLEGGNSPRKNVLVELFTSHG